MKKLNLKINLKNKKNLIKLGIVLILIIIILVIICNLFKTSEKVTCTINNELIKGFNNEETIVFEIDDNIIKNIEYNRKITINDFYKSYGTYIDSLDSILSTGYNYMKNKNIETTDDTISISFNTNKSGVILNNLNIVYNTDSDKTSLRYDVLNDLDNEETAFKVGDKYSKTNLKKEIKKLGYTCK